MKLTKPKFPQNISRKMAILMAASFVALFAIGLGTPAIVLACMKTAYGASISFDSVSYITYRNQYYQSGKELHQKDEPLHAKPMRGILDLLNKGSRTNKLSNLFRGNPKQKIESNSTNISYNTTFDTTYAANSITIRFNTPQYSVNVISRNNYELVSANGTNDIYGIMIPMDMTDDKFQTQTWYLITTNPFTQSQSSSIRLPYTISVYGNYHDLWEYINDLYTLL